MAPLYRRETIEENRRRMMDGAMLFGGDTNTDVSSESCELALDFFDQYRRHL